jgi:hypothetical protein
MNRTASTGPRRRSDLDDQFAEAIDALGTVLDPWTTDCEYPNLREVARGALPPASHARPLLAVQSVIRVSHPLGT